MSTDKRPEDQITEAGAVELDESQLEQAAGGIIAVEPSPEVKLNPTLSPTLNPTNKFNPIGHKFSG